MIQVGQNPNFFNLYSKANREFAATYPATKFIQKYVPNARLLEQIGSEVIYVLPTDDPTVVKKFEQLFTVLDRYMAKLKIKSYGLSDTTLEEVGRIIKFCVFCEV